MIRRASILAAWAAWSLLLLVSPRVAHAAILTFDDIPGGLAPVPNGYGGLNWDQFNVHDKQLPGTGYFNGVVSGTHVAYNNNGALATVLGGLFNFNAAYLTGAWNNGLNVKVDGYVGPTQIYTKTTLVNVSGPTLVNFNFVGIDRLVFTSFGGTPDPIAANSGSGNHFVMDDFNYTVPEPASFSLACVAAGWLPLRRASRRA